MGKLIVVCAWCKKVKNEKGEWEFQIKHNEDTIVTHTICEKCAKEIMKKMQ